MSIVHAIILGIVQGLTEFLPVSSSGHIIIVSELWHWGEPSTAFQIALHLGTLLAVVVFFWAEWKRILSGKDKPMLRSLAIATIITAVIAALVTNSRFLAENPITIVVTLTVFGLLLWWVDSVSANDADPVPSTKQSAVLGVMQAVALVPGVSRSGILITAARGMRMDRAAAARYAFLLSAPIIAMTPLALLLDLGPNAGSFDVAAWVGLLVAAVSGWLAIRWLMDLVKRASYGWFAAYRILLAIVICIYVIGR